MAVADQREKNSFYSQALPQEVEAKCAFANRINYQSKTQDLSCLSRGLRLQSWLPRGRMAEGVNCLSPSKGAPIHSLTNLHHSVEHGQLHHGRPL
jgi:hypothetical protein